MIAFTFIFIVIKPDEYQDKFWDTFMISYRINLGDFDTDDYNFIDWLVFILATLINPIIMLNLLIALMSDTYSRV